jgi:circadian clock protein KaiC
MNTSNISRLSTGVGGLDEILQGGVLARHTYLVRGGPGSGKTTLCLHFLAAGLAKGEKGLFVTLGEAEAQVRQNAALVGIDIGEAAFLDLSPTSQFFAEVETYDIFRPAEVEREPTTAKIIEAVQAISPRRVVIDSMTQFRYLATDPFQYRKQSLSFLRFLTEQGATVLFISEGSEEAPDEDLQFLSDGVIDIRNLSVRRTVEVRKFRGSDFHGGVHTMRLTRSGMTISPRLVPEVHRRPYAVEQLSSGIPELDELLHGGIERGTITIISGPTGVGKTTLGLQFMKEAAGRGERSIVYSFEETREAILYRCEALNIPARIMTQRGTLAVETVEPLAFSPDEFGAVVRHEVEEKGTRIVMLDSLAGYRLSHFSQETSQDLHTLCRYFTNMGVTLFLVVELATIAGGLQATEIGLSYLADNILFLRYMELHKRETKVVEMRKAIGVLKKRLGDFDKTLRELEITRYGLRVNRPMGRLSTIFGDLPVWEEDGA